MMKIMEMYHGVELRSQKFKDGGNDEIHITP